MNRLFPSILILSGLIIFLNGCKKEQVIPLFEVESIASMTIPAGLNTVETHHFIIRDLTSTLYAQLETRNLSLDDINIVKPQLVVLTSLDNETEFNFLEAVTVDIYTRKNTKKAEIAFQEFVPFNTRSELNLFPSLLNVKDYLAEELFIIEVELRVRTFIARNVETRIDLIFRVEE